VLASGKSSFVKKALKQRQYTLIFYCNLSGGDLLRETTRRHAAWFPTQSTRRAKNPKGATY
jgi:hypothetical protein